MGHFYDIESAYTDRLYCQRKERILPRICAEGVLTKYAMVVQVMMGERPGPGGDGDGAGAALHGDQGR